MNLENLSKSKVKYFSQLKLKKYRQSRKEFIIEGAKLCLELLESSFQTKTLIINKKIEKFEKLIKKAISKNVEIYYTNEDNISKIATTENNPPVIAIGKMKEHKVYKDFFENDRFLVLFDLKDPGNLGTLFRTAVAFNWNNIILTENSVEIYNPKVLRASMGAIFHSNVIIDSIENIMSYFVNTNVHYLVTAIENGISPEKISLPSKFAIFLGNESTGLPEYIIKKAHSIITIPIKKNVESLNVSIAGALLLYIFNKK